MITYRDLTDEVAKLMRDGYEFREACRKVLEDNGITGDWDRYFSRIDQMSRIRNRKRKSERKIDKAKAVQQRPVSNTDADFNGLSPKEIRQKLADSNF